MSWALVGVGRRVVGGLPRAARSARWSSGSARRDAGKSISVAEGLLYGGGAFATVFGGLYVKDTIKHPYEINPRCFDTDIWGHGLMMPGKDCSFSNSRTFGNQCQASTIVRVFNTGHIEMYPTNRLVPLLVRMGIVSEAPPRMLYGEYEENSRMKTTVKKWIASLDEVPDEILMSNYENIKMHMLNDKTVQLKIVGSDTIYYYDVTSGSFNKSFKLPDSMTYDSSIKHIALRNSGTTLFLLVCDEQGREVREYERAGGAWKLRRTEPR